MSILTSEKKFYDRHFKLPGFNETVQERLRSSSVLVLGVGGLGCPAALYLAGAGVGRITLCDADEVSETNLHRQTLFDIASIGKKKVTIAADRLRALNPYICIDTICREADVQLLTQVIPRFDVVIDCTDNFDAKYAINDVAADVGVPLIYGTIFQFAGQVSVFHYPTEAHPSGFSYRDLHPDAPPSAFAQSCGEAGVMGVLPGVIGTLQANEAIKVITGLGETLAGYLLTFDALSATTQRLKLAKRENNDTALGAHHMIEYGELLDRMRSSSSPVLIDVREHSERQICSIGGEHIPLATLPQHLKALPIDRDIVVYCKSGARSAKAALYLRSVMNGTKVFHLNGGIDGCTVETAGPGCVPCAPADTHD
ncbi:ThiF family adenylyltransferase [Pandoraea pneumonica]|uniref:ThiF family adenylyltransferase n=1 Tax=Pandoraea pneumonica TaxID=2508299 RepID=UPI003CE8318A